MNNPASQRVLTVFSIIMITITSVDSIRNLPATALFGAPLIFFFLVGAFFFLLPAALVSAELASAFPERGGIYLWVKAAFGSKWGFMAIWCQWVENAIWYPTILSFLAGTLAYLFTPQLAANKYYLVAVIWLVFWSVTLLNLRGLRTSVWFSIFCGIAGLILPMTAIIILGCLWGVTGKPMQIQFTWHHLLPDFTDPSLLVSMTGVLLSYCGIEIATVHAREVKHPQRDFPRALLISTCVIAFTLILGSLAIAIVVPNDQLSLVAGIMQAFERFFAAYHISWLVSIIAVLIVIGLLASVSNWTLAPVKGLLAAAQDGNLPPLLQKENAKQAPVALLILQALIVTLVATIFVIMPSVNSSYWLLTVVAAQLYMLMYIIMFITGLVLRYRLPQVKRPFMVPGGKVGLWIISSLGLISASFTMVIGFFPPKGMGIQNVENYEFFIIILLMLTIIPPFIIYAFRKPHWLKVADNVSVVDNNSHE